MLCKESVVFILIRVFLTAHEQHVLQVVAEALHMSLCVEHPLGRQEEVQSTSKSRKQNATWNVSHTCSWAGSLKLPTPTAIAAAAFLTKVGGPPAPLASLCESYNSSGDFQL